MTNTSTGVVGTFMFIAAAACAGCSAPSDAPRTTTPSSASEARPSAATEASPVTGGWTITEGINAPESTYFDPESKFIFSSQVVGQPDALDGNGRIAKLTGDGKMIASDWVTGLNAPKGLRAHRGTLWVADLGEVDGIEIATGKVTTRVKIPDSKLLNDVACGDDGTVYVSDTVASRIYMVKDGQASVFADGEMLEYPNGLLVMDDRLIVGGWGKPEADFSTKVPGRLFALDLKTRQKTLITPMPFANIDGVESDGRGGYILTDFTAGKIVRVSQSGESTLLKQFPPGTADLGFVSSAGVIIVPHMNENKVATYDISEMLK